MKKIIYTFIALFLGISSTQAMMAVCSVDDEDCSFSDVPQTHKNYEAINYLSDNEIVNGFSDGTFKPDQQVNRAEALKMILLGSGINGEQANEKPFSDVETGEWFAEYIYKAKQLGIVNGNEDGTFAPARTLNLAEALKMVIKTNNVDVNEIAISFDPYQDVPKDSWFAPYFQYAKEKNLLDKNSAEKVNPDQDMTRGELAEIMYRIAYMNESGLPAFIDPNLTQDDPAGFEEETEEEGYQEVEQEIGTPEVTEES